MMKMGGPVQQARNFAVMTGVNAGVLTLMRRIRKVDDMQNSLAAAFASGACFSLVSGMGAAPAAAGAANPLMGAVSAGVVFAAFQGAIYKLGEAFSGPKVADTEYARVKAMLTSLGLAVGVCVSVGAPRLAGPPRCTRLAPARSWARCGLWFSPPTAAPNAPPPPAACRSSRRT